MPRRVCSRPRADYFKPRGIPVRELAEVLLTLDELEALRLADLEGLYQEAAAEKMKVSRQTFGNIVAAARHKVADALVNGKALKIEGGEITMVEKNFKCSACNHEWGLPYGSGRPVACPSCKGGDIHRSPVEHGRNRGGRGRRRCRRGGE